ncbi:hypothetical protein M0R72_14870 [Candidatus Pacearchaeota archaeon]|jgi:hypothetical protein|nr:hypothetical protein [Candidatus Pacearchaeota archaeon]
MPYGFTESTMGAADNLFSQEGREEAEKKRAKLIEESMVDLLPDGKDDQ